MKILQPSNWPLPKGYSNGIACEGTVVFIAGQIGWDKTSEIVSDSIVEQTSQALKNVITVLKEAKGAPNHISRMTWFVTSRDEYLANTKEIGAAYRSIMGDHYPAMSLVEVKGLLEKKAKVEIEATAVIPR